MYTFFLTCAVLGGATLALQLVLAVAGLDHHHGDFAGAAHHAPVGAAEGLHFLSVRALTAGVTFFGVAGLAGLPGDRAHGRRGRGRSWRGARRGDRRGAGGGGRAPCYLEVA